MLETNTSVASSTIEFKTELVQVGSLGTLRIPRPHVNPRRLRRRMLHGLAHAFQDMLTRTTVHGLENIPGNPARCWSCPTTSPTWTVPWCWPITRARWKWSGRVTSRW